MDKIHDVNKFKETVSSLLPLTKKYYTNFYGIEYDEKINSTIDSVRFAFIDNDKNKLCKDNNGNVISINSLNSDDIASINKSIEILGNSSGCTIPGILPPIVVLRVTPQLSLHSLIHEVNHSLHFGEMSKLSEDDFLSKSDYGFLSNLYSKNNINTKHDSIILGITGGNVSDIDKDLDDFTSVNGDIIYEIFNDYMTKEILANAKSDSEIASKDIDTDFYNGRYIFIDESSNCIAKQIYSSNKDYLKNKLIEGKGFDFLTKFGARAYLKELMLIKYYLMLPDKSENTNDKNTIDDSPKKI